MLTARKYRVRIEPSTSPVEKYSVFFSKTYGDYFGGATPVGSKEELFNLLKSVFKTWEGYDSILRRNGDKVTPRNLEVETLVPDVTVEEIISLIRRRC